MLLVPDRLIGVDTTMYQTIKLLHVSAALLTITGFLVRGFWMMSESRLLQHKLTRVLPHIIDTIFLASGIYLVVQIGGGVLTETWMIVKIAGLIVYIVLGIIALRRGRTPAIRLTAFVAAIAVYAYVYGVAVSGSPASWLKVLTS